MKIKRNPVLRTRNPVLRTWSDDEIIADNFAGGGGASSGMGALGRRRSAWNEWRYALKAAA